jgi:purine-cytosine permease-like protein
MIFSEKHEITDIVIIIIVCITAVVVGIIGVYTYYKSYEAFIGYLGVLFLTYATISLLYTFLNRSDYSVAEYNINLGLDITAVFITLVITIFFTIKSFFTNVPVYKPQPVIYSQQQNYQ